MIECGAGADGDGGSVVRRLEERIRPTCTGGIPEELGDLSALKMLCLHENELTGEGAYSSRVVSANSECPPPPVGSGGGRVIAQMRNLATSDSRHGVYGASCSPEDPAFASCRHVGDIFMVHIPLVPGGCKDPTVQTIGRGRARGRRNHGWVEAISGVKVSLFVSWCQTSRARCQGLHVV